jgi:hypothetical protein
MTRFWRSGFLRTNANGTTYRVAGHMVDRDDWDRQRSDNVATYMYYAERLSSARARNGATTQYINPNADCPVCGAPVFFFQNTSGSRVYFDELGPPWPKHPCTDHPIRINGSGGSASVIQPLRRSPVEIEEIQRGVLNAGLNPEFDFHLRYKLSRWSVWSVCGRFRRSGQTLLVLDTVENGNPSRLFMAHPNVPKALKAGSTVYSYRNWLIFFDLEQMIPVEIEMKKLRSASAFVNELVAPQKKKR